MAVFKRTWTSRTGEKKSAWCVDYTDGSGKRRRKTFPLKSQANTFAANTHVAVRRGVHVADSASVTVAEAGAQWLTRCEADGLERSTLDQYEQHMRRHINPRLGAERLSRLTVPAVRSFQDAIREDGASPAMVRKVTVTLGSIISDAQERGEAAHNPVRELTGRRGATNATRRQKRRLQAGVDIPTVDEVKTMIAGAKGRWRPILITAAFTGMRASELRGLRWSDVDLVRGRIHVRQRADRFREIGLPKSDAGQRTIPVGPRVVDALKAWRDECPESDLDLVFPNAQGKPLASAKLASYVLWPAQKSAGLIDAAGNPKYMGMHALRHFYASLCINRKADKGLELPAKTVQARLGHSSIVITLDTYGHLFPGDDDGSELELAERSIFAN